MGFVTAYLVMDHQVPVDAQAGVEDGVYSLVHVDWDTGEEVGRVIPGSNPIFNTAGGFFIPLNENDIYVTGIFGPVRISKKVE